MKYKIYSYIILFFIVISVSAQNYNTERILNFHSDIKVDTTGRIEVTEKIRVNVTGQSIGRGIVRTLPLYRKDANGDKKRMDFTILSVDRNGETEEYKTQRVDNDLEIYIGNKHRYLPRTVHEYTIVYESYGHVGFFNDYDEIYWNVTGNDWAFPIDSVSATIYLPAQAKVLTNSCYTGMFGSKEMNCTSHVINSNTVEFIGNEGLSPKEGLTVATSFTPHIIKRPPPPSGLQKFWNSYGLLSMFVVGLLFFGTFLKTLKHKIQEITTKPIVIPRFDPPKGFSASAIRYITQKGFDEKAFTACILSLAVKKALTITEDTEEDRYILTPLGENTNLSTEELEVYQTLFADKVSPLYLDFEYNETATDAYYNLDIELGNQHNIEEYYPSSTKTIVKR